GQIVDDCPKDHAPGESTKTPAGRPLMGCPDKNGNGIADSFEPKEEVVQTPPAEADDSDPVPVPEGPLDGDTVPTGDEFDRQVTDYCREAPVKRGERYYVSNCRHGGTTFYDKTYVCTSWDSVYPYIHGCNEFK